MKNLPVAGVFFGIRLSVGLDIEISALDHPQPSQHLPDSLTERKIETVVSNHVGLFDSGYAVHGEAFSPPP